MGYCHGYVLHRDLRNTAADVIDCGDEGQGGRFVVKGVRTRGLPLVAIFISINVKSVHFITRTYQKVALWFHQNFKCLT